MAATRTCACRRPTRSWPGPRVELYEGRKYADAALFSSVRLGTR